ncbi:HpcH/HpaI aldolase/citrate lyase family protein [Microvirga lotononidis]|uniref:Citrate lyase beta subunit n=1 Tax=Microvirga lotononidis TaxID=864069 RepID=I4YW76_9HYPH|nr:CoA ester lyase [Microvirga lotononidis]EIM28218.1 citrate lyase beta subunit [Microvirga lotononidis]WQO27684.1 CoA ester lyase [Microvirga lotononidis]
MRSLLFVPGDSRKKLEKAMNSGADVLLIDLEDSVALDAKQEARRITASFLAEQRSVAQRPRLFVRVNGLTTGLIDADLDDVIRAAPDGIVLPKTIGGPDVAHLGAKLAVREAEFGLEDGGTRILAIATENAAGVFALGTFAGASHRLMGLTWGGEDLSADLGAETNRTDDGAYTDPYRLARSLTLLGAAAAGIDAIDSVFTNFRDTAGLEAECRAARRDGFAAKMAIHPAQVPVINETFTPSAEAIERARAVIVAFKAHPGAGVVGVNGEMLDRPHLLRAERLLRRAGRLA